MSWYGPDFTSRIKCNMRVPQTLGLCLALLVCTEKELKQGWEEGCVTGGYVGVFVSGALLKTVG